MWKFSAAKGRSQTSGPANLAKLLKHDQFIDTTQHGLEWASENRRSLILVGSIVAVLIAIVAVAACHLQPPQRAGPPMPLAKLMLAYQSPIAAPGQQIPPGVKTHPSGSSAQKAANQLFVKVADNYGMTPSGKLSRYFAGLTYVESGQNGPAESTLKQVAGGWNGDLAFLPSWPSLSSIVRPAGMLRLSRSITI